MQANQAHASFSLARFKAAAVQAGSVFRDAPVWFDTEATLNKAIRLTEEACDQGARLVVFPETWLPGFPYWSTDLSSDAGLASGSQGLSKDMWAKYLWSSIEVPGPEVHLLCETARRCKTFIVMGINERDRQYRGRMYNTVLYIDDQGRVIGKHRKICPTSSEQLFHTPGEGGENLKAVFPTAIGRLGGTICGEHAQLPLIYQWTMLGVDVHCSLWPGYRGIENATDLRSRHTCLVTNAFGIVAAAYFNEADYPTDFHPNSYFSQPGRFRGGSGIISPSGSYLAGPVFDKETIVYAEIDLADCDRARHSANLAGLYHRWDLFQLHVQEREPTPTHP
ncbi:MAG: carbon-nitrogen hydrolase family protein, partial [Pigmentiphaga sp.]